MKSLTARRKARHADLGKLPVVVLPLEEYERMREELDMLSSKRLARKIGTARKEADQGKLLELAEVKRRLGLS